MGLRLTHHFLCRVAFPERSLSGSRGTAHGNERTTVGRNAERGSEEELKINPEASGERLGGITSLATALSGSHLWSPLWPVVAGDIRGLRHGTIPQGHICITERPRGLLALLCPVTAVMLVLEREHSRISRIS